MTRAALLSTCATLLALTPALAEETRELDAHEHGHGALNIAIEGAQIQVELEVPGFDIVGFEYEAETDADKAKITAALDTLGDPTTVLALPKGAGCEVIEAKAELHGEDDHDDHDDHAHDDAAKDDDHDDHAHDDDAKHDDHDDHAEAEAVHSEFHVEYAMTCADIGQLTTITLPYFDTFTNAEELEVQMVTKKGAQLFEASRDANRLDLSPLM